MGTKEISVGGGKVSNSHPPLGASDTQGRRAGEEDRLRQAEGPVAFQQAVDSSLHQTQPIRLLVAMMVFVFF